MSVKVLMTWDISPDRDQDYFEFVIGEFVPGVQRLGLQPIEAWATIYGQYPQIQVGLLADDAQRAERILNSPDWVQLQEQCSLSTTLNPAWKVIEIPPAANINYHPETANDKVRL